VRGTHVLETADRETSQDRKIIRVGEGHSHSGKHRGRDKSGHEKNARGPGAITIWRAQAEGQIKTRKECERARDTHILESADRGTSQDRKGCERVRGTHELERRERGKSGHGKNASESRHSRTSGDQGINEDTERM
jgi:hypothetical protein